MDKSPENYRVGDSSWWPHPCPAQHPPSWESLSIRPGRATRDTGPSCVALGGGPVWPFWNPMDWLGLAPYSPPGLGPEGRWQVRFPVQGASMDLLMYCGQTGTPWASVSSCWISPRPWEVAQYSSNFSTKGPLRVSERNKVPPEVSRRLEILLWF